MTFPSMPLHGLLVVATTTKSSSSSFTFILFLVVIGLAGYFLLLRPQKQKARRQRAVQSDIGVGDEILTVGGIVGTVLDIDSERVTIVTGLDPTDPTASAGHPTRMVLVRNAIARKIEPLASGDFGTEGTQAEHPGYGDIEYEGPGGAQDDHAGTEEDDNDSHSDDQGWTDGGSKEGGDA